MGLVLTALSTASAEDDPLDVYTSRIAPIFQKYCNGCHNEEDAEGKLVLETYEGLRGGGKRGAIVVPGKSPESRLVLVLEGKAKPRMPPGKRKKPTADEILLLKAWIDAGARGPLKGTAETPDPSSLVTPRIEPIVSPRRPINSVAFSPDGRLIALAGYDEVQLISVASRTVVRKFAGRLGNVAAVSFSKDGRRLLTAGGEAGLVGEARIWNVDDGTVVTAFRGHKDALYAARLSPDGTVLATGSYDQEIKLWNVETGKVSKTLSGHNGAVFAVAFRPDGKVLASASGDRTVKLWDVATGVRLETLSQSLKELYAVRFSPDGKRLAAGGADNRIRVWEISEAAGEGTNPIRYSQFAHEGGILNLAFSPDGSLIVSSANDDTVKIWKSDTLRQVRTLERQSDWTPGLSFAPDGRRVVVGRQDGTLSFYDVGSGRPIRLSFRGLSQSPLAAAGKPRRLHPNEQGRF